MEKFRPTKAETWPCVCLRCGKTSEALFWLTESGIPYKTAKCPKCSNAAIRIALGGIGYFMSQVAAEIVTLRMDIMDIQGKDDEDR
jgi:DNA-directed RNA polymerase subunit RPC12/RpoP